jgi:hypothetical protein
VIEPEVSIFPTCLVPTPFDSILYYQDRICYNHRISCGDSESKCCMEPFKHLALIQFEKTRVIRGNRVASRLFAVAIMAWLSMISSVLTRHGTRLSSLPRPQHHSDWKMSQSTTNSLQVLSSLSWTPSVANSSSNSVVWDCQWHHARIWATAGADKHYLARPIPYHIPASKGSQSQGCAIPLCTWFPVCKSVTRHLNILMGQSSLSLFSDSVAMERETQSCGQSW